MSCLQKGHRVGGNSSCVDRPKEIPNHHRKKNGASTRIVVVVALIAAFPKTYCTKERFRCKPSLDKTRQVVAEKDKVDKERQPKHSSNPFLGLVEQSVPVITRIYQVINRRGLRAPRRLALSRKFSHNSSNNSPVTPVAQQPQQRNSNSSNNLVALVLQQQQHLTVRVPLLQLQQNFR